MFWVHIERVFVKQIVDGADSSEQGWLRRRGKSWNSCTGKYPRTLTSISWSSTDPPSRLEYAETIVVDLELFGLGKSFGSGIMVLGSTFLTFTYDSGQNRF
jgi:hypothetical protein